MRDRFGPPDVSPEACCGLGGAAPILIAPIWPSAWMNFSLAALRGAKRPDLGTGMRSIEDARGLPCSIGLNVPEPLRTRPGLPCAKGVATRPGMACAVWPDLKSETS